MKILVLLTIAVVSTTSAAVDLHPLSDEYINLLNSRQSTWEAGRNFPESTPLSDIRRLMGVLKDPNNKKLPLKVHAEDTPIPESFDAREYWPKCTIIKQIRDQSACGSCWAIAAVSAMSDRICIHSNGTKQIPLSASDLMACCWWACGYGCNGGLPNEAWEYWVNNGIVSGGEYNSKIGCKPYPFPQCEYHSTGSKKPCQGTYDTPKCFIHCDEPSEIVYNQDKSYGKTSYTIGENVQQIQLEILKNGPVEASFDVYNDFLNYKKGQFHHIPTLFELLNSSTDPILLSPKQYQGMSTLPSFPKPVSINITTSPEHRISPLTLEAVITAYDELSPILHYAVAMSTGTTIAIFIVIAIVIRAYRTHAKFIAQKLSLSATISRIDLEPLCTTITIGLTSTETRS